MSTSKTLDSSYKGVIARFVRLSLNDPSIRACMEEALLQNDLYLSGEIPASIGRLHSKAYLLTVAHAILAVAHEHGTIGVFFRLGAIAQICNVSVTWDECPLAFHALTNELHGFLKTELVCFKGEPRGMRFVTSDFEVIPFNWDDIDYEESN